MLAEQSFKLTQARHLGAVETKPARDLSEVAAAMRRVDRINAMSPEFVGFGPIATIIDDADQQLDAVTARGLQLLDVLIKAAVAVDEHHLSVVARGSNADGGRKTRADSTEVDRNVILPGLAAAQMRHRKTEAMAAGDDDVPVLWHCSVQFFDDAPRVERAGRWRIRLGVRVLGGRRNPLGNFVAAPAATADALFLHPADNRLGGCLGVGLYVKVGSSQPLPQSLRLGVDPDHLGIRKKIAAFGRVVAEPGSCSNHQIAFGEQLAP